MIQSNGIRRIAILSTNNNPDYFFYAPITEWCWNKLGWDVALFKTHDVEERLLRNPNSRVYSIPNIEGVRTGTQAQVVRHFVANVFDPDCYLMVQDIDLLPLKEWNPDLTKNTIYGWELTGRSFIPVHYTGMMRDIWMEVMGCTRDLKSDMEREMKANGRAYQEKWEDYWDADWDILTQKVLANKSKFTFIDRGMVQFSQYQTAKGRIDRINLGPEGYKLTMNQEWIDLHAENHNPTAPHKWAAIRGILEKRYGTLPEWMDIYVTEHHKKHGI